MTDKIYFNKERTMPKTFFINGRWIETVPPEPITDKDRQECQEIFNDRLQWICGLTLMEILLRERRVEAEQHNVKF